MRRFRAVAFGLACLGFTPTSPAKDPPNSTSGGPPGPAPATGDGVDAGDAAPNCPGVPQVRGEVFRYNKSSSVPEVRWEVGTEELGGLDFDGSRDRVFRVPKLERLDRRKDVTDLAWDLYIVRQGCAVHLGSFEGHAVPQLTDKRTKGFYGFTVIRPNPHADPDNRKHRDGLLLYTRYTFDGKRYVGGPIERR